ncbi:hypothetical protein FIBSPDRAFT_1045190 [Athelia psychrophila]|uniref:Uncharacterized protein n=1 Tax=Athelia psychrophila TaxID=1759441 RepID=A0A166ILP7_9AGAM|nr:hypothetical protein FIBSPDRAFT_1045190 [Fibularhizoctonia sp. CBS 109695]
MLFQHEMKTFFIVFFFGTGNQTPSLSSAILERVFMDPNMCLVEYSPISFLVSIPSMQVFLPLTPLRNLPA